MAIQIVDNLHAEQYTGSNGAALVAEIGATLTGDDGTTLSYTSVDGPNSIPVGEWVIWFNNPSPNVIAAPVSTAFLTSRWVDLSQLISSAVVSGVGSHTHTLIQASGGPVAVPASVLGQTANYDVTVSPALPNTSYKPLAHLRGAPTILSGHSILNITALSTTVIRVQVQSAAASLAGASVYANAYSLA